DCGNTTTVCDVTELIALPLHDALPISSSGPGGERDLADAPAERHLPQFAVDAGAAAGGGSLEGGFHRAGADRAAGEESQVQVGRSEEHTSELQSRGKLVGRRLLAKKKN